MLERHSYRLGSVPLHIYSNIPTL